MGRASLGPTTGQCREQAHHERGRGLRCDGPARCGDPNQGGPATCSSFSSVDRVCRADRHLCDRRILTSELDRPSNIDPSKGELDAATRRRLESRKPGRGPTRPADRRPGRLRRQRCAAPVDRLDRPTGCMDCQRQVGGPVRCAADHGRERAGTDDTLGGCAGVSRPRVVAAGQRSGGAHRRRVIEMGGQGQGHRQGGRLPGARVDQLQLCQGTTQQQQSAKRKAPTSLQPCCSTPVAGCSWP